MKVKICGITNYEDAAMIVDQGADALGFNFFPQSPRYIAPADARSIIRRIPPFAVSVGLFVNVAEPSRVSAIARAAGVQVLQLHGDETPEYCRSLAEWPLIKALRIGEGGIPGNLEEYPVQAFLLDVKDDTLFGGTGKSFDWELARSIKHVRPIILAGGLTADNLRKAIQTVDPYAVDVCSGVESAPGEKSAHKVIEFMNEVRNVNRPFHRS
jgi:phosphoribosylanthranilate isomerase